MDNRLDPYEKRLRIPKYIRLKEAIRQSIEKGELKPHARLASRNELMAAYGVSDTTVKKAINELANEGYLYLEQGKGTFVAERKSKPITIALVVPNLSLSYHDNAPGDDIGARLTEAIQDEARRFGASILLYLARDGKDTERENLQDILKRHVDGLILFHTGELENLEYVEMLRKSGVPIVFIDRSMDGIDISSVTTDNYKGAFEATDLLIHRGFRNVYHITQESKLSSIAERKDGYLAALDHYGLPKRISNLKAHLLNAQSVMEESYGITKDLICNADRPFAVFALNSAVMIGAWRALSDERIPHDQFALAGFDEIYIQMPDDVLIIKVLQPLDEIGRKSIRVVMK